MATIGNKYVGLIDVYKRSDRTRAITPIIEALNTLNPLMRDANVIEANQGTSHLSTIRTNLPAVTWGRLYQGIPHSKSGTAQVTDTTGFVEGLSFVDNRLLRINRNPAAIRMSEGQGFLEAMAQDVQRQFFYADSKITPEIFLGVGARYNTLSNPQVVNGGGVGSDNTSIWMVTWGDRQTSLIYPEGTTAGISREDHGQVHTLDDLGNRYYGKEEQFTQHVGVTTGDTRYNARIANIDVSDLKAGTVDIYGLLRKAYYRLQGRRTTEMTGAVSLGRTVIYANRDVLEALDAQATNTDKIEVRPDDIEGAEVTKYRGLLIRETDALINAETLVA